MPLHAQRGGVPGAGIRITCPATRSASCSSGSSTDPTSSLAWSDTIGSELGRAAMRPRDGVTPAGAPRACGGALLVTAARASSYIGTWEGRSRGGVGVSGPLGRSGANTGILLKFQNTFAAATKLAIRPRLASCIWWPADVLSVRLSARRDS